MFEQPALRSLCPVANALDVVGDRWTLLVIRDLFAGKHRFGDLLGSSEHIPTNILAERLKRLEACRPDRRSAVSDPSDALRVPPHAAWPRAQPDPGRAGDLGPGSVPGYASARRAGVAPMRSRRSPLCRRPGRSPRAPRRTSRHLNCRARLSQSDGRLSATVERLRASRPASATARVALHTPASDRT